MAHTSTKSGACQGFGGSKSQIRVLYILDLVVVVPFPSRARQDVAPLCRHYYYQIGFLLLPNRLFATTKLADIAHISPKLGVYQVFSSSKSQIRV